LEVLVVAALAVQEFRRDKEYLDKEILVVILQGQLAEVREVVVREVLERTHRCSIMREVRGV
jgi:hypothetical protein